MFNSSYKNLPVWQKAENISANIFQLAPRFMAGGHYALMSQMQRAALSVSSSLSEGWSSGLPKTFASYTDIAKASLAELEAGVFSCQKLDIINDGQFQDIIAQIAVVRGQLTALRIELSELDANNRTHAADSALEMA